MFGLTPAPHFARVTSKRAALGIGCLAERAAGTRLTCETTGHDRREEAGFFPPVN